MSTFIHILPSPRIKFLNKPELCAGAKFSLCCQFLLIHSSTAKYLGTVLFSECQCFLFNPLLSSCRPSPLSGPCWLFCPYTHLLDSGLKVELLFRPLYTLPQVLEAGPPGGRLTTQVNHMVCRVTRLLSWRKLRQMALLSNQKLARL